MLVSRQYPGHTKFARLTRAEEAAGLFEHPEIIGTRNGWALVLEQQEVLLAGHQLRTGQKRRSNSG
jgi:hypothetical protein